MPPIHLLLLLLLLPLTTTSLLLIPPSLPSPRNLTTPLLGDLRINCYIQPLHPEPRLPRAQLADCYSALQQVLIGDKAMAPMHFSHDARRGFHVPFAWGHDTCQIIINNVEDRAEGTFQLVLLAHLAAEIMESCIVETPANLGGDVRVGPGGEFEVVVAGTEVVAGGAVVKEERRKRRSLVLGG